MKICTKCGVGKPLDSFHRHSKRKDGRRSQCKACVKVYDALPHRVAYHQTDERKIASAAYGRSEAGRATQARHRAKPERIAYAAEYAKTPKRKAVMATYAKTDTCKTRQAGYWKTPAGRANQARARHKRRQHMQANVRDFTAEQWQELLEEFDHCCAYCGCTDQKLTQDHVIPVSKMGQHTKSNIVPACQPCNSGKGNKDPMLWATSFGDTK